MGGFTPLVNLITSNGIKKKVESRGISKRLYTFYSLPYTERVGFDDDTMSISQVPISYELGRLT